MKDDREDLAEERKSKSGIIIQKDIAKERLGSFMRARATFRRSTDDACSASNDINSREATSLSSTVKGVVMALRTPNAIEIWYMFAFCNNWLKR